MILELIMQNPLSSPGGGAGCQNRAGSLFQPLEWSRGTTVFKYCGIQARHMKCQLGVWNAGPKVNSLLGALGLVHHNVEKQHSKT